MSVLFVNACVRSGSRTLRLARHFLEHISGDVETVNLDVDGADTDSLLKAAEEEINHFFAR